MTEEDFAIFQEIVASAAPLRALHPLKLDRWHRALVDLPLPLYMQLGVEDIFLQIDKAAMAIKAIVDILGKDHLPLPHSELARRHIGKFSLHVPHEGTTVVFQIRWDKATSKWFLEADFGDRGSKSSTSSLEEAVEKAQNWEFSDDPTSSTAQDE
jgi:hypothetical protein